MNCPSDSPLTTLRFILQAFSSFRNSLTKSSSSVSLCFEFITGVDTVAKLVGLNFESCHKLVK